MCPGFGAGENEESFPAGRGLGSYHKDLQAGIIMLTLQMRKPRLREVSDLSTGSLGLGGQEHREPEISQGRFLLRGRRGQET